MKLTTTLSGGGLLRKRYPHTGLLLLPVGFRKDGRAILPILGGDPTEDDKDEQPLTFTHAETISRMEEIA